MMRVVKDLETSIDYAEGKDRTSRYGYNGEDVNVMYITRWYWDEDDGETIEAGYKYSIGEDKGQRQTYRQYDITAVALLDAATPDGVEDCFVCIDGVGAKFVVDIHVPPDYYLVKGRSTIMRAQEQGDDL
jgi:hypothetical protein